MAVCPFLLKRGSVFWKPLKSSIMSQMPGRKLFVQVTQRQSPLLSLTFETHTSANMPLALNRKHVLRATMSFSPALP